MDPGGDMGYRLDCGLIVSPLVMRKRLGFFESALGNRDGGRAGESRELRAGRRERPLYLSLVHLPEKMDFRWVVL